MLETIVVLHFRGFVEYDKTGDNAIPSSKSLAWIFHTRKSSCPNYDTDKATELDVVNKNDGRQILLSNIIDTLIISYRNVVQSTLI